MKLAAPVAYSAIAPAKTANQSVSIEAVLQMRHKPNTAKKNLEAFAPYEPPKGILPAGHSGKRIAMDAGFNSGGDLALLGNVNEAMSQGYAWPGFTELAYWAQIPEYRKPAETYAREMTRKWIKLQAVGDEDKSDKIAKIDAEFKRLNVQAKMRKAIELDGFYGRAQIFIDVGLESDQINQEELKTDLVESPSKVGLGSVKRLTVIEPIWSYPNRYNANDPLDPTFYKPISWFVMGKEIHSSRLITIVTREVPDILKPAYAFAGLSLSQMLKPYVDNWLRTRQSVSDIIRAFTVWVLKTNMNAILNGGAADSLFRRLQIFNLARDNHGVMVTDKDTEEFSNIAAPINGLDKLQAQSQEQMSAPCGVPLVYLTGITPTGLNASSDGEIKIFKDNCAANQEIYTPAVSKILNLVQLSLFGEIDPGIGFIWEPLYTMSGAEIAVARKTEADTDVTYLDAGVLAPDEVRKKIANQEDSPYAGLDLDAEIEPPADPANDPGMQDDEHDEKE